MPRMVKFSEKMECVKPTWEHDLNYKYVPPSKLNLYQMIEDIIDEILPEKVEDEFFKSFVDVKEVPYGECITDTDNRRSITELSRLQFERNYRPSNSIG